MKAKVIIKKAICYILGLFIITIGINISKLSHLGISPVSSIPRACEVIFDFTLGTTTYIIYTILVLAQIALLRKKFKLINILGVALAFVFGYMVDITGTDPNAFGHLMYRLGITTPDSYIMKLVFLVISVIVIGIGVFMYLMPRWVPMPAEGLAQAISDMSGKAFGDCKTAVDVSMITIALILQLIFLGGFKSFTGDVVVVREGTVVAAVCVGQVVKFLAKKIGTPVRNWLNK